MITAPRHGDVVCEADCTTGRPLRPSLGGPGSHAGSGPQGREVPPVSWGDGSPPLLEPAPPGARAGLCPLQRCLSVSAASCGHELGAASPLLAGAAFQHWEISGDGGQGCFNSGFWGEMA